MEKILEAKNLRISFRTNNGKVQAVRDINFKLYKGETLAIVGESGSGKSVTAKAVMGILAPNAIVESGEIIYDGKDLMKIPEDEFHSIRGDKIAMIFQDPLSSLNPIMKVGNQLTEAMIIKGKARQKEAKILLKQTLKNLNYYMNLATNGNSNAEIKKENAKKINTFKKFIYKHLELEMPYNSAVESANHAIIEIDNILEDLSKKNLKDVKNEILQVIKFVKKSFNTYFLKKDDDILFNLNKLNLLSKNVDKDNSELISVLNHIKNIFDSALKSEKPNFFRMGYYFSQGNKELPDMPIAELNDYLRKYLDDNFMLDFIATAKKAIIYSYENSIKNKTASINEFDKALDILSKKDITYNELKNLSYSLVKLAQNSINKLSVKKESLSLTFKSSMMDAVHFYKKSKRNNQKELKRYDYQTRKYNKKVQKGKTPDWKVIPADIIDLDKIIEDIKNIIIRLRDSYKKNINMDNNVDFDAATVAIIDFIKEKASGVVYKVTPQMAKQRALELMEEVGISEPRKRFKQYPFQFSGGMRQRIVIAIALAANPDILICDEPTTALDVTIQAQILELINKLKRERQISVIFITHDLGVVANMADRIAVMYAGKIVEYGTAEDVFYSPAHPYTWALLSSMPDLDTKEKLEAIPGTPPNMIYPPKGDAFAARNKYALKIDFEEEPPMFKISDTHFAATWLLHPNAPKVEPPKIVVERIQRMKRLGEIKNGGQQ